MKKLSLDGLAIKECNGRILISILISKKLDVAIKPKCKPEIAIKCWVFVLFKTSHIFASMALLSPKLKAVSKEDNSCSGNKLRDCEYKCCLILGELFSEKF